jgi:hypothetical protein
VEALRRLSARQRFSAQQEKRLEFVGSSALAATGGDGSARGEEL